MIYIYISLYIYIYIYSISTVYVLAPQWSVICGLGSLKIATRIERSNLSNDSILASLTANNDQTPTVIYIYMYYIYIYYIYNIIHYIYLYDILSLTWSGTTSTPFEHGALSHDHFPQENKGFDSVQHWQKQGVW